MLKSHYNTILSNYLEVKRFLYICAQIEILSKTIIFA